MTDNAANTRLVAGVYKDLYVSESIAIGTQIECQNIGVSDVRLYSQAASPVNGDNSGFQVVKRGEFFENQEGDSGAWAMSYSGDGLLNIKVAV